jgi:hypothetical protein
MLKAAYVIDMTVGARHKEADENGAGRYGK